MADSLYAIYKKIPAFASFPQQRTLYAGTLLIFFTGTSPPPLIRLEDDTCLNPSESRFLTAAATLKDNFDVRTHEEKHVPFNIWTMT